uniref:Uncharacterized protein n=1 Tax=Anopheles arabiensis TaxID=7173 RepID=A0A182IIH0_ANOAR
MHQSTMASRLRRVPPRPRTRKLRS